MPERVTFLAEADGEFIDLTTRLGRREAELRNVRADQSELRRQLIRAEDRANKLRWQLDSIHASRAYRAFQLLRAARRQPEVVRIVKRNAERWCAAIIR